MKDDFLSDQLHQGDAKLCKTCLSKQQKASADAAMQARLATTFTCKECKVPKNCTSFPPTQWDMRYQLRGGVCAPCCDKRTAAAAKASAEETHKCHRCGQKKKRDLFSEAQWRQRFHL